MCFDHVQEELDAVLLAEVPFVVLDDRGYVLYVADAYLIIRFVPYAEIEDKVFVDEVEQVLVAYLAGLGDKLLADAQQVYVNEPLG